MRLLGALSDPEASGVVKMARMWDPPEKPHLFYLSSVCGSILFRGTWPEVEDIKQGARLNLMQRSITVQPDFDDRVVIQVVPELLEYTRTKTKERLVTRTKNSWRAFAALTHCAPRVRSKKRPKIRGGQVIGF